MRLCPGVGEIFSGRLRLSSDLDNTNYLPLDWPPEPVVREGRAKDEKIDRRSAEEQPLRCSQRDEPEKPKHPAGEAVKVTWRS